ncbi:MAG TPA: choline dehydrogenase [Azospirillaceae bacterium]|nr:choline dehydrogenase [Azospirillaceae bacterium]
MYDYVIVGGGSAGCVMAARLSEDPDVRVCLLEAGPADKSAMIHMPFGILGMMRSKTLNWNYTTEPQRHLNGRRLFWPRGKTLGGSSASNAMIYIRGHAADYDSWEAEGNPGWGWRDVLPLFKRAENNERGADAWHGTGGPLNVADHLWRNPLSRTFVDAGVAAGHRENPDFNGPDQEGFGFYQVTQKGGQRCSAARGYLRDRTRPNLTIVTGARATRILMERGRAVGVAYRQGREERTVRAEREVILSGGAINSPQLLLLSGIGPAGEIRRQGLPVVHELPGVGRNLQDHLDILLTHRESTNTSFGFSRHSAGPQIRALWEYFMARKGMLTTNVAEAGGFIKSDPGLDRPDLQLHCVPSLLEDHGRKTVFGHGISIHVCQLRPASRGRIGLKSPDPMADALIDPDYLSAPEDLAVLRRGLRLAREIMAAAPLAAISLGEIAPAPGKNSDADLDAAIRARAETIYHPVGTCRMGVDAQAVVDPELRVRGLDGLRVVDASIMPTLIGGNTNAPTIMIAEKASDLIRGRRNARADERVAVA